MVSGTVVWFEWTAFVHTAESKPLGICQVIFGTPALLPLPWSVIDPLVIALLVSLVVMFVFQKQYEQHIPPAPVVQAPAE